MILHLLVSPTNIAPGKEEDGRIPGKRQGRREEGRSLRIGEETGSGARRTIAEGPKGQGIELRKWPTLPTKPALGTEETDTESHEVRTRHKGGRAQGTGQDHRVNSTKLLVAKNERTNHRLRQKLPRVPKDIPASTLRAVLPAGTAIRTLEVNSNGLYHRTPDFERLRSTMGDHQLIHQNGALPSFEKRRKNGGGPGGHLRKRSMQTPRAPH